MFFLTRGVQTHRRTDHAKVIRVAIGDTPPNVVLVEVAGVGDDVSSSGRFSRCRLHPLRRIPPHLGRYWHLPCFHWRPSANDRRVHGRQPPDEDDSGGHFHAGVHRQRGSGTWSSGRDLHPWWSVPHKSCWSRDGRACRWAVICAAVLQTQDHERFRGQFHPRSLNNSAFYPRRDLKYVEAYLVWATRLMPRYANRGDGMSTRCTAGEVVR